MHLVLCQTMAPVVQLRSASVRFGGCASYHYEKRREEIIGSTVRTLADTEGTNEERICTVQDVLRAPTFPDWPELGVGTRTDCLTAR